MIKITRIPEFILAFTIFFIYYRNEHFVIYIPQTFLTILMPSNFLCNHICQESYHCWMLRSIWKGSPHVSVMFSTFTCSSYIHLEFRLKCYLFLYQTVPKSFIEKSIFLHRFQCHIYRMPTFHMYIVYFRAFCRRSLVYFIYGCTRAIQHKRLFSK